MGLFEIFDFWKCHRIKRQKEIIFDISMMKQFVTVMEIGHFPYLHPVPYYLSPFFSFFFFFIFLYQLYPDRNQWILRIWVKTKHKKSERPIFKKKINTCPYKLSPSTSRLKSTYGILIQTFKTRKTRRPKTFIRHSAQRKVKKKCFSCRRGGNSDKKWKKRIFAFFVLPHKWRVRTLFMS